jgi:hypothetical protein
VDARLHQRGEIRDGAWVAELTGLLDLSDWPQGMRVIARKERPHPGAQLRLTDIDGHRITAFTTNTRGWQLPDLELRHRRRARAEDLHRPRTSGPHWTTHPAAPRRQIALGRLDRQRDPPTPDPGRTRLIQPP